MEDLQYLHYQTQLEEQEYEQLLADGLLLHEMRPQTDNSNQTILGEEK